MSNTVTLSEGVLQKDISIIVIVNSPGILTILNFYAHENIVSQLLNRQIDNHTGKLMTYFSMSILGCLNKKYNSVTYKQY